eukprot:8314946-Alexandrium_andersonii.AAC.1
MDRTERYLLQLFRHLDWAEEETLMLSPVPLESERQERRRRRAARARLAKRLSASLIVDGRVQVYRHVCALGCHASVSAATADITNDILVAHLDQKIPIPALNRSCLTMVADALPELQEQPCRLSGSAYYRCVAHR